MAFRCGNCGGFFSQTEVTNKPPPRYPWTLTASGQKVIAELERVGGDSPQCPGCGQRTLLIR
jgi:hypothetical protein